MVSEKALATMERFLAAPVSAAATESILVGWQRFQVMTSIIFAVSLKLSLMLMNRTPDGSSGLGKPSLHRSGTCKTCWQMAFSHSHWKTGNIPISVNEKDNRRYEGANTCSDFDIHPYRLVKHSAKILDISTSHLYEILLNPLSLLSDEFLPRPLRR